MSWAKFDDRYDDHPRVRATMRRDPLAAALHAQSITACARHETDGLIDPLWVEERAPAKRKRDLAVATLVEFGLWDQLLAGDVAQLVDVDERPVAIGPFAVDRLLVHNYLRYNPSRAAAVASRGADRSRKELLRDTALVRAIRERDGDRCRYCGVAVDWRDRRSKAGGTYDHVMPTSCGGRNTFDNVVVACRGCNLRKGARTPLEAGMDLAGSSPRSNPGGQIDLPLSSSTRPDPTRPDPLTTPLNPPEGGSTNPDATVLDGRENLPQRPAGKRASDQRHFEHQVAAYAATHFPDLPDPDRSQAVGAALGGAVHNPTPESVEQYVRHWITA